jgi:hypothetical protein
VADGMYSVIVKARKGTNATEASRAAVAPVQSCGCADGCQ